MTLELEFKFTPRTEQLTDNEIREINTFIASSFMNAGFGGVREEPNNVFVYAFAVPVFSAFGEYEREIDDNIVIYFITSYRFVLPLEHGDIGFFINSEVARIKNSLAGLNPDITFDFNLKFY